MARSAQSKDERRIRGTGGLYQRASDSMWVAAVELPQIGGKRRRKVIVRARKADALAELRKLHVELAKSGDIKGASPSFETWSEDWMKRYGKKRKPTNWGRDQSTIDNYLLPTLAKVKLDKLTVKHVHEMHAYVTDTKPAGLGLSPTTANLAHRLLSTMLEAAFAEERVARNVAKVAGAPSKAVVDSPRLTSQEAREVLLRGLDPGDGTIPQDLALMVVAFFTGMRPAERLGLMLKDPITGEQLIDLDRGEMTVAWQLQRIQFEHGCGAAQGTAYPCGRRKAGYCPQRREIVPASVQAIRVEGGLWLTRPKTRAGWRKFDTPDLLNEVLRIYTEANPAGMNGLMFTRPRGGKGKGAFEGRPLDPSAYTARWHELLAAFDLPAAQPHSARHTANTILMELGVPVDVRIKILGHATASSNDVYTHTSDARVREGLTALSQELDWRRAPSGLSG